MDDGSVPLSPSANEAMISLSARGFSTVEGAEEVEQLLGKGVALLSQKKCLVFMGFNMI